MFRISPLHYIKSVQNIIIYVIIFIFYTNGLIGTLIGMLVVVSVFKQYIYIIRFIGEVQA